MIDENTEDTSGLGKSDKEFLECAINDYNEMFSTSFDVSADKFQNYYKDVSKKVKEREVDILIVVNMFLTGFDATTLNTLWVDKNLRYHGLLQAYSRTNRILNSIKRFGNIVCFRKLEQATNDSISLFGDKDAGGIVLIRPYKDYYFGYKDGEQEFVGYKDLIDELLEKFPVGGEMLGENMKKEFIRLYGDILKARNILTSFDEFEGNWIISEAQLQNYQSIYIDLYNEFRKEDGAERENINDDLIFEIELIKQVDIGIDYIIELIKEYNKDRMKNKELLLKVERLVNSSIDLRNKKDLIFQFIDRIDVSSDVITGWRAFVDEKFEKEIDNIIKDEGLDRDATYEFMKNAFRDGAVQQTGTSISDVLPKTSSRFSPCGERTKKREDVLQKFSEFFEKFFDIASNNLDE